MRFETLAIHAGHDSQTSRGAVTTPIYQTSTFEFEGFARGGPFTYSRTANPTRTALEKCLAAIEGGTAAFAHATGLASETTILAMLSSGDHILVHDDLYGGTFRLIRDIFTRLGLACDFVNMRDLDLTARAFKPDTKMLWTETPTNPLMNILDLRSLAGLARDRGVLSVCDNTFLTPYFQKPLELGIDIVVHSTTKYINGHCDVVGGAVIVKDEQLAKKMQYLTNALGTCAGPQDCYLVLRGLKTLAVRMEAHQANGLTIARWLEQHPKVKAVHHPLLESHPQRKLFAEQCTGCGGTFSFRLQGGRAACEKMVTATRLFTLAESLGGVASLIGHSATMSHASMPAEIKKAIGLDDDVIRLSVGLEHVDDLVADLDQALAAA